MRVLLVNSKILECGVYQYGKRINNILKSEDRYTFVNLDTDSVEEFKLFIATYNPDVIIYNWHASTMSWLSVKETQQLSNKKQFFIFHESSLPSYFCNSGYLMADMSQDFECKKYPLVRPLFEINLTKTENKIPVIGSFGFGFQNKGFEKICSLAKECFDQAIVKLHITNPYFGDYEGNTTNNIIQSCKNIVANSNIQLETSSTFLTDEEILAFLNSNSLNVFLYDELYGRGLSSVIDYALSVNTPLAVNNSYMFRHITSETPNISISNGLNLKQIMNNGIADVLFYRTKWNNLNFKNNLFNIIQNL